MDYIAMAIGSSFADESAWAADSLDLAFVGADAGTIDVGPYQLGGLGAMYSEQQCRRDLERALGIAARQRIPLVVGSCGGDGSNRGVDWLASILREIPVPSHRPLKVTKIYSEPDRSLLKSRLDDDRIRALGGWRQPYTHETIDRSTRIVSVLGAEPFCHALEDGAQVVLAGRATDAAIYAAPALRAGYPDGLSWHAARVAECGTRVAEPPGSDILHIRVEGDAFYVVPLSEQRCTTRSVASQLLYEKPDQYRFVEPSGTLDTSAVRYEQVDERSVRLSGAVFEPADTYTVKLEGVELAGYQSIAMASFTDPVLLAELDDWLGTFQAETHRRLSNLIGAEARNATMSVRAYGGGLGTTLFPSRGHQVPPTEVFILIDAVGWSQKLANNVVDIAWHALMHNPVKGWSGRWTTGACPYNPPVIDRGPVYRFNCNHVMELDRPDETARLESEIIGP